MSTDRALRKQQQLNNLVYMVLNQAKPGDRIVDFCSGGVLCLLYPLVFPKIMRPCYIAFKVMILSGKIIVLTVSRSHSNQSYFFCLTSQGHVGIALAHVLPSCQVRAGPGKGREETAWESSGPCWPHISSLHRQFLTHQYVPHTLLGSKLLRSES